MKKKLEKIKIDELYTLYSAASDILNDYARMTDMYSLSSGDERFERLPEEVRMMIEERQMYFNLRNRIKTELKKRLIEDYE